jgi:hypothetical protein
MIRLRARGLDTQSLGRFPQNPDARYAALCVASFEMNDQIDC